MMRRDCCALFGVLALLATAAPVRADYLDPSAFASVGTLNLAAGNYTIDTNGAPTLRDSSNNILYTGTTYFQGGSFDPTISVLTFDSITIAAGVNIRAVGSNPLALLSKSSVLLAGTLDASGFAGHDSARFGGDGAGGAGGAGAGAGGNWAQAGQGPGGGPAGAFGIGVVQAGGGGFGGKGGDSVFGTYGAPYGNLYQFLQGGSGGGGTGGSFFDGGNGAGGGGGGGAIELGALGSITFANTGKLVTNGGGTGSAFAANAGAGSGGGLLIHAPTIGLQFGSVVTAQGGAPFGGGGRILILTNDATVHNNGGFIDAGAGGGANNQQPGVVEYGYLRAVPEPSTMVMSALGGLGLGIVALVRSRRRAS
ncbi:MAG: PEP-CTERM sorting domain-containing protein [Isosphaeraceae bacterium]